MEHLAPLGVGPRGGRHPIRVDGLPAISQRADYDLDRLRQGMTEVHRCLWGVEGWLGHTEGMVDEYIGVLQDAAPSLEDVVDLDRM